MKNLMRCIFSLALLTLGQLSAAQTFPHGYMPLGGQQAGCTGCAPMASPNQDPVDPGPEWASRWGAIATTNGAYGFASDKSSQRLAKKAALKECKSSGGKKCSIQMVFYNQCAALAWGYTSNAASRASQLSEAESDALLACGKNTGNCQIFRSECSYAQRIR